jgi:anti-sigma-K factor RskA
MDKEKIINSGLIEQYVLGLTSEEENQLVEECAETYPEVKKEITDLRKALEGYARKHAIHPPQGLKDDILRKIDQTKPSPPFGGKEFNFTKPVEMRSGFRWSTWVAAAGLIGLVFLSASLYNTTNTLRSKKSALEAELASSRANLSNCESQLITVSNQYALLKDPGTLPVLLNGTEKAPDANVVVFYNPGKNQTLLQVIDLPEPPKGKQYQIWADVEGEMINMGLLAKGSTDPQALKFIENAESFNITLEPEGGSKHPTVELLVANGFVG